MVIGSVERTIGLISVIIRLSHSRHSLAGFIDLLELGTC
jgi:hypothetical protein